MTANENRLKSKDVAKRPGEMVKPAEIIGKWVSPSFPQLRLIL